MIAWLAACAGDPSATEPSPDAGADAAPLCSATEDDVAPVPRCTPTPWRVEQLDARTGTLPALAVTRAGHPVITWSVDEQLFLLEPSTQGWRVEPIAAVPGATLLATVAVDPRDGVHVAYDVGTSSDPRSHYAHRPAGGAWELEALGAGVPVAVAADRCHAHALLWEGDGSLPGRPVHARRVANAGWQRTLFDERGWPGSLALGPDGAPHLLYLAGFVIRHARLEDRWRHRNLATTPSVPRQGLAVARDGAIHAAFVQPQVGDGGAQLRHGVLRPDASDWQFETVATSAFGDASVLALDPEGRPYLASSEGLPRLRWRGDDGVWRDEPIPIGRPLSLELAIDGAGGIHVTTGDADAGVFYGYRCLEAP